MGCSGADRGVFAADSCCEVGVGFERTDVKVEHVSEDFGREGSSDAEAGGLLEP